MSEAKTKDEILKDKTNQVVESIKKRETRYSPTKDIKQISRIRLKMKKEVTQYPTHIKPVLKITF